MAQRWEKKNIIQVPLSGPEGPTPNNSSREKRRKPKEENKKF